VRAVNIVTDSEFSATKCTEVGLPDTPTLTATATPEDPVYECSFEVLYDGPRTNGPIAMMQNGDVFIAGGMDVNGVTSKAYIFSPKTKTFRYIGDSHYPNHQSATTLTDGRILLPFPQEYMDEYNNWHSGFVEIFDPVDENFIEQQTPGFCVRWYKDTATAITLPNGKVLIVCQNDDLGAIVKFQKYDVLSDTLEDWLFESEDFCFTRFCHAPEPIVTLFNNWVISNGFSAYNIYSPYFSPEEIPINIPDNILEYLFGRTIALSWTKDKLYLAGGYFEYFDEGRAYSREALVLDTDTYTLSKLPSFNIPRMDHNLLPLTDGNMIILGGTTPIEASYGENPNLTEPTFDTKIIGSVELFDSKRQRFYDAGSLNIERIWAEAITLLNGDIFVYGGRTDPGPGYSTIAPPEIGRCERVN
jgi:hypothetical protein